MKNFLFIFLLSMSAFTFAQEQLSPSWFGNYSLDFSRKRSYAPTMYWEHQFSISKNSCNYEGSGFQFYLKYKCSVQEKKDTLFIHASDHQDGYETYDKGQLIMKLYKWKNNYYTQTTQLKPEEAENRMSKYGYNVKKNK
ncbi:DUF5991 domain-containing protein [Chryseobacterium sp. PMSZPI]|uniref:DUF5991 domain-containing protein n=1 Tax=Chryseobacterium sp. PMSZPI TaxID=1033900 RepID=UPI00399F7502